MANETVDFADYVLRRGDGTFQTLLTAPFTVAGDALLPLYRVTRPAGAGEQDPIPLAAKQRAGLLTQPSILEVQAHANHTKTVILCMTIRLHVTCESLLNSSPPPL